MSCLRRNRKNHCIRLVILSRLTNACNRLAEAASSELGSASGNGFCSTLRHEGNNMFGAKLKLVAYKTGRSWGTAKSIRHITLQAADAWRWVFRIDGNIYHIE